MVRLIWLPSIVLVAACSSPTEPTVVSTTNHQPPTVVAPVAPAVPSVQACTSAQPQHFRVSSGERVGDRWKNYFTWDALGAPDQVYVVWVRKMEQPTAFTFTNDGTTRERYDIPDGLFVAKVRLACSERWSDEWEFSNGAAAVGPSAPRETPKPPRCTGRHGCGK